MRPRRILGRGQHPPHPTRRNESGTRTASAVEEAAYGERLAPSLSQNLRTLRAIMDKSEDLIVRQITIGQGEVAYQAALVFFDGLVNSLLLSEGILAQALNIPGIENCTDGAEVAKFLEGRALTLPQLKTFEEWKVLLDNVLMGDAALLIDGSPLGLVFDAKSLPARGVTEPMSESTVRGSHEGFTEVYRNNTAMLRRRLQSPNLRIEVIKLGVETNTSVGIAYISGLAKPDLLDEVRARLGRIGIDGILESGYIEELIEDSPLSPFPTIMHTERPDVVAAGLLEGKVAIMTDGTPVVMMVPTSFWNFINPAEDYYERFLNATFLRWVRVSGLIISFAMPALYVALLTFHQEMIPTTLAFSIASGREGVPFPAIAEALLMELSFELLRETGLRMPRPIGQAVSIVGALVVGQAAVSAGVVSPLMIIITGVTGVASFVVPGFNLSLSLRLLRFPLMIIASILGAFGLVMGTLLLLIHLVGLRSFGYPFLAPLTPRSGEGFKDVLYRAPWWSMLLRPKTAMERVRQSRGLRSSPKQ